MNPEAPAPVRIQKFLSQQGLCSRREAETWVQEGRVKINGVLAQIGQSVTPGKDHVKVRGKMVSAVPERKIALVMNKPKGVLCTNDDPEGGTTVFDLLPSEYRKLHLYCAGRLDKDSEGLLILTNDGDLAQQITHPSGGVVKRYQVTANRAIDPKVTAQFVRGVRSEDETLIARKVVHAETGPLADRRVDIYLDQGRKREIRRMFEAFGYFVKELRRYQMGSFVMRKLGMGAARLLTQKERALLLKPASMDAPRRAPRKLTQPYQPYAPTARERRYAAQKAQPVREDKRPFSHRALVDAKLGDNVLDRLRRQKGGARSVSGEVRPATSRAEATAGRTKGTYNTKGARLQRGYPGTAAAAPTGSRPPAARSASTKSRPARDTAPRASIAHRSKSVSRKRTYLD